jgi:uncharacterized protein
MILLYKIKDIPEDGRSFDLALDEAFLKDALDGLADLGRSRAQVHLELSKAHEDVIARGTLKGTLGLECSSCLQPLELPVTAPLRMVYRHADAVAEETGVPSDQEDQEVGVHDGKEVDLQPIVREQLILSVPPAPRCKEDCQGLCPTCGQDKNLTRCGHGEARLESPFSALKGLKLE